MRTTIIVVVSVLAALSPRPGHAQTTPQQPPPAPRAFQFPDTLGANFAIGDSATKNGTVNDYDFLDGLWTFKFQQRRPDGQFQPAFPGHWLSKRVQTKNAMLQDLWRGDNPNGPWESGTYSYRVYNPGRKIWTFMGVNSEVGDWEPGLSWSDANNRYVIQHYGKMIMRIRYFNITPTHFQWRGDSSNDGGKTWILDFWTMEASRVGN